MSAISPNKSEYNSPDALKIAKDVSWVIRTLWTGAAVTILAAVWIVALASDVKTNTNKIDESATKSQIQTVIGSLSDIKKSLVAADGRQREMKSQLDRVETEVEYLKERTNGD